MFLVLYILFACVYIYWREIVFIGFEDFKLVHTIKMFTGVQGRIKLALDNDSEILSETRNFKGFDDQFLL